MLATWTSGRLGDVGLHSGRERSGARGVIRVLPLAVVGQNRLALQSLSKQPSRGRVALALVAVISELQALGIGFDGFASKH